MYSTLSHYRNMTATEGTRLPLPDRTKSLTFPDEIADKCTFIDIKSACYEVSVAFQQVTKVNSKTP